MKERPILFSGEMVRAILEGRKTQTRMVIEPQPSWVDGKNDLHYDGERSFTAHSPVQIDEDGDVDFYGETIVCPYGQPGDRLWVRETFAYPCEWTHNIDCDLPLYKVCDTKTPLRDRVRWRSSIHMPRWASRINLEITDVSVERLQDITEEDARSEGAISMHLDDMYRRGFQSLWDSINLKRGYGWDANPWVWVVEFKRLP